MDSLGKLHITGVRQDLYHSAGLVAQEEKVGCEVFLGPDNSSVATMSTMDLRFQLEDPGEYLTSSDVLSLNEDRWHSDYIYHPVRDWIRRDEPKVLEWISGIKELDRNLVNVWAMFSIHHSSMDCISWCHTWLRAHNSEFPSTAWYDPLEAGDERVMLWLETYDVPMPKGSIGRLVVHALLGGDLGFKRVQEAIEIPEDFKFPTSAPRWRLFRCIMEDRNTHTAVIAWLKQRRLGIITEEMYRYTYTKQCMRKELDSMSSLLAQGV